MDNVRRNVLERDVKVDLQLLAMSEETLDQGPVGHDAIPGDGVEVEIVVQVVWGPLDLEHNVPMLAISRLGLMAGSLTFALQIKYTNVTIIEPNTNHVRMGGVDVKTRHP